MKRIFLTIIGAVVCTASAYAEVSPLSFGLKVGGGVNMVTNYLERHGEDKGKSETTPLNMGYNVNLYGEYAFHDMLGAGMTVGYIGGSLQGMKPKGDKKDDNTKTLTQGAFEIAPYLGVYPLGREDKEEMGIMFVNVGGRFTIPVSTKFEGKNAGKDLTEAEKKIQDKDVKGLGIGAFLAAGYEFSFGMTVEAVTSYMFTDTFTEKYKDANKTKSCNVFNAGLGFGYNFATLLED